MTIRKTLIVLITAALSACVSAPNIDVQAVPEGNYAVEKSHASITFSVQHFGLSWYTMRFNEFDVALDFDPTTPEASKVVASIDPLSIDVWHPDEQAEWEEELATDSKFLDANSYPEIRFESSDIELSGENQGTVTGDLTLKGVTKPIVMNVTFNGSNSPPWAPTSTYLGFSATGSFNRSDFGMDALLPNIVGDTVRFSIEIEFQPS